MITAAAAATSQVSGPRLWVPVSRDSVEQRRCSWCPPGVGPPTRGRPAGGRRPGRPRAGAPAQLVVGRTWCVTGSSPLSTPHVRTGSLDLSQLVAQPLAGPRCSRMLAALAVMSRTVAISAGRRAAPTPTAGAARRRRGGARPSASARSSSPARPGPGAVVRRRVDDRDLRGQPLLPAADASALAQAVARHAVRPRQRARRVRRRRRRQQTSSVSASTSSAVAGSVRRAEEPPQRLDQPRRERPRTGPVARHRTRSSTLPHVRHRVACPTIRRDRRCGCPEMTAGPPPERGSCRVELSSGGSDQSIRSPCRPCRRTGRPSGRPSPACRR